MSDLFTPYRRTYVDAIERRRLEGAGAIVVDSRRSRPRYFDGRFLAARDLTNDQQYVHTLHTDLGRAAGSGVVQGLEVSGGTTASQVTITAGTGVTPAGETVVLRSSVTVNLYDLRQAELLDAQLGLRRDIAAAARVRTGPFVLALRPVEFTANPRRGYPTSVGSDARGPEDHDIVEATAITLVPWPTAHAGTPDRVRGHIAREVFVTQSAQGLATDVLPIAMVYLDGVSVRWLDQDLVRRSVGADHGDVLGLGITSRAVRAAYVRQYDSHLETATASGTGAIAAADWFDSLPPVGRIPLATIDRTAFTQSFFPPEVDVDIALVPEDELALLADEALLLPPIDLVAEAGQLAGTAVLVLVPTGRTEFRQYKRALDNVRRPLVRRIDRAPALRTPSLALSRLKLPWLTTPATDPSTPDPNTATWTSLVDHAIGALGGARYLWYVRRRNTSYRAEIEGNVVDMDINAPPPSKSKIDLFGTLKNIGR